MANEVKVSFVGDTKDLAKKLDNLEADVKRTSKEIEAAADDMRRSASKGFGGLRDSADDTERRIVGFRDSLTGTQDVMKGLRDGDMVALSTGFADLASSVANLGADMLEWGRKAFEAGKKVVAAHGASVVAKAKDIASSIAHRAATLASTVATQAQAAAQWALNAAMNANPITLIVIAIAALVAAIIVAYKNVDWFREAVDAVGRFLRDTLWPIIVNVGEAILAFGRKMIDVGRWIWDNIVPPIIAVGVRAREMVGKLIEVARDIVGWVTDVIATFAGWNLRVIGFITDVLDWFGKIPGRIADFFIGLAATITAPFRSAFNAIADLWNNTVGRLSFSVPSWVPEIGGKGWDVPDIPKFDTGGTFRAPIPGGVGLAMLRDGEKVSMPGLGGSGVTVIVQGSVLTERSLVDIIQRAQRRGLQGLGV